MDHTGRLRRPVLATARRILFDAPAEARVRDLDLMTEIDRAHLVMLVEQGLVDASRAARLLGAIDDLRRERFAPLLARPAARGLYLLYEDHLIETQGADTGGRLQTARSRNDLNATLHKLSLRAPLARLMREALRLQAVLIQQARRYRATIMPLYTHMQPAAPTTYGHYLAAGASALQRHVDAFAVAERDLQTCPLGAGAGDGARRPIDPRRTAALLGFDTTIASSIDAVASRDGVLLMLGVSATMGVAISRIASDLLQWSTGEFGFLDLPDAVAGSSSAMPQKRNPFLLEHAQSRWTSVLGAFVAACTAMHAAPFTNAIAVGTEGVRHASGAFRDLSEAIVLLRLVVARATPRPERMAARAREGLTSSLAAAEALVDATGMDFRSAHRLIGALIEAEGQRALDADVLRAAAPAWPEPIPSFDPDTIARRSAYGGGSATTLTGTALDGLRSRWREQAARARALARQWEAAAAELDRTVQRLCLDSNRAMYLASALNTPAVGGG